MLLLLTLIVLTLAPIVLLVAYTKHKASAENNKQTKSKFNRKKKKLLCNVLGPVWLDLFELLQYNLQKQLPLNIQKQFNVNYILL